MKRLLQIFRARVLCNWYLLTKGMWRGEVEGIGYNARCQIIAVFVVHYNFPFKILRFFYRSQEV